MLGAGFAYRIGNHLGKKISDKISGTDKLIEWNLAKELYGEDVCRYLEKMNGKPTSLMTDRERQAFNIVKTVTKQWNRSFDSGKYDIPERMKEMDAEAKAALDWNNKDKSKWQTRLKEMYPSELFFFVEEAKVITAPTRKNKSKSRKSSSQPSKNKKVSAAAKWKKRYDNLASVANSFDDDFLGTVEFSVVASTNPEAAARIVAIGVAPLPYELIKHFQEMSSFYEVGIKTYASIKASKAICEIFEDDATRKKQLESAMACFAPFFGIKPAEVSEASTLIAAEEIVSNYNRFLPYIDVRMHFKLLDEMISEWYRDTSFA